MTVAGGVSSHVSQIHTYEYRGTWFATRTCVITRLTAGIRGLRPWGQCMFWFPVHSGTLSSLPFHVVVWSLNTVHMLPVDVMWLRCNMSCSTDSAL